MVGLIDFNFEYFVRYGLSSSWKKQRLGSILLKVFLMFFVEFIWQCKLDVNVEKAMKLSAFNQFSSKLHIGLGLRYAVKKIFLKDKKLS